jgi:hypothetical protein
MAIDETRHELFTLLDEQLGTRAAALLMAELPPTGWRDFATKRDIDAQRTELRGEMTALRAELRGEMVELRAELRGETAELRGGAPRSPCSSGHSRAGEARRALAASDRPGTLWTGKLELASPAGDSPDARPERARVARRAHPPAGAARPESVRLRVFACRVAPALGSQHPSAGAFEGFGGSGDCCCSPGRPSKVTAAGVLRKWAQSEASTAPLAQTS